VYLGRVSLSLLAMRGDSYVEISAECTLSCDDMNDAAEHGVGGAIVRVILTSLRRRMKRHSNPPSLRRSQLSTASSDATETQSERRVLERHFTL
jgi:hypothetical protein